MNDQFYRSEEIRDLTYREKRLDLKSTVVLTPREKEVLKLILKEKTTNEIGEKLDVSSKTVEKHRANLFIKFAGINVVELVIKSIMEGYSLNKIYLHRFFTIDLFISELCQALHLYLSLTISH